MKIQPVILAGGEGKRLAPLSTAACPKPFIPLPDGQSLLEKTLRRVTGETFLPPIIVGQSKDRYALLNHARAAGVAPGAVLLEDAPRNTAFAVACAVRYLNLTNPQAMLLVLPADHVIEDIDEWKDAAIRAARLAELHQSLALIGMKGLPFSSDLGYMALKGEKIESFIEKPKSKALLAESKQWLANSGQFIGTSSRFSDILAKNAPKIWGVSAETVNLRQKQWEYECLSSVSIPFETLSFDKAVLEKQSDLCGVATSCGWRDLGTLEQWLVYTNKPLKYQINLPERTDRPWGYFEMLESTLEYTAKRLYVFPGCRLSRQRHFHRSEHWTVESGTAYIEKDHDKMTLGVYESIKIPPAVWHRLVNPSEEMLIIKEIQYGVPDEGDIEREEDDYGRL